MKTRLIRIGNSRGVRLPKVLLEQAGLEDAVEVRVEAGALIISPITTARAGWAEAAAKYDASELLDPPSGTTFDEEEWSW